MTVDFKHFWWRTVIIRHNDIISAVGAVALIPFWWFYTYTLELLAICNNFSELEKIGYAWPYLDILVIIYENWALYNLVMYKKKSRTCILKLRDTVLVGCSNCVLTLTTIDDNSLPTI